MNINSKFAYLQMSQFVKINCYNINKKDDGNFKQKLSSENYSPDIYCSVILKTNKMYM